MYLLPCPQCQESVTVSPSQAGDETKCSGCNAVIEIPRLGDLRKLNRIDEPQNESGPASDSGRRAPGGSGSPIAVIALGLLAVVCLFAAAFAGIRCALIDVATDTEGHVAQIRAEYENAEAAQFVIEFESMEKSGIDMPAMYTYKTKEIERRGWGIRTAVAGAIALLSGIAAIMLASKGRTAT